jgi:hypothetical protein
MHDSHDSHDSSATTSPIASVGSSHSRPRRGVAQRGTVAAGAATLLAITIAFASGCVTVSESSPATTPVGTWTSSADGLRLDLRDDGAFTVTPPTPRNPVRGRWTLDGDRIEFRNDADAAVCPDVAGTYGWTLEEGSLFFTLVEDGCAPRRDHMTSVFTRTRR